MTVDCPGCQAAVAVPKVLLVQECPTCGQKIKSAADMKGEPIVCPGCQTELHVPGQPDHDSKPLLVAYLCPECHAEVEAPDQIGERTGPCPGCGEQVHFRRRLYLKTPTPLLPLAPEARPRKKPWFWPAHRSP